MYFLILIRCMSENNLVLSPFFHFTCCHLFVIKQTHNSVLVLIFCSWMFISRYILEGKELEFYTKKLQKKKGKGASGAAAWLKDCPVFLFPCLWVFPVFGCFWTLDDEVDNYLLYYCTSSCWNDAWTFGFLHVASILQLFCITFYNFRL